MKTLFTRVLLITAAVMFLVVIFPPWQFKGQQLGFSFIGSPLGRDLGFGHWLPGEVNVSLMLAEMAGVIVIGGAVAVAVKR